MARSRLKVNKSTVSSAHAESEVRGNFPDIFNWAKLKGIERYKPKKKENLHFNILPWEVKSKLNPYVHRGTLDIGEAHFMLDIWVHRLFKVGNYICPKRNYGKPCPMCEEAQQMADDGIKEGVPWPSRRSIVALQLIENGEPAEEPVLLDASYNDFGKEILEEASEEADGEEGDILNFADPDEGYSIKLRTGEGNFSNHVIFKKIQFLEREEVLTDDILEKTPSLDAALVEVTYQQLEEAFHGGSTSPEPDDEDEDGGDGEVEAIDEDISETKEPEKAPTRSRRTKKTEPSAKCPFGHRFGKDCGAKPDCDKCSDETYNACEEAADG